MSVPYMDIDHLRGITDGDPDLEERLCSLLKKTAERCIGELGEREAGSDAWKEAAHELKGASANVGAKALSEACKEAEGAQSGDKERVLRNIQEIYGQTLTAMDGL